MDRQGLVVKQHLLPCAVDLTSHLSPATITPATLVLAAGPSPPLELCTAAIRWPTPYHLISSEQPNPSLLTTPEQALRREEVKTQFLWMPTGILALA